MRLGSVFGASGLFLARAVHFVVRIALSIAQYLVLGGPPPVNLHNGFILPWACWLMLQKLEHREQRIAFEELMESIRQESERVERLEQSIREAVPEWSLAEVIMALQAADSLLRP